MAFARALLLCLLVAVSSLGVSGLGATRGLADTVKVAPTPPFIDQSLPFYGCGLAAAVGAGSVAFPRSMTQWTFYQGVYPSMATVLWRSTLGCFYGVLGGTAVSAARSTVRLIGDAWHRAF